VTRRAAIALALASAVAAGAAAQRRGFYEYSVEPSLHNVRYDGRFTFARIKYQTAPGGYWYQGMPSWSHGYPVSEDHLLRILNEVTLLRGRTDGFNVFALDDPELFKYPVAYIIEVGWWTLTDGEAAALRSYMDKGGFVIVDDFKTPSFNGGGGWELFESNMQRVVPGARFYDMEPSHPIFHSFFEIHSLSDFPQAYNAGQPIFRGLYEDNDRRRRLQMIVNYNTDISQYWEWSGRGLRPFDETNEAYKLGVNYVMYGMTH
jgi:hypothetical protein